MKRTNWPLIRRNIKIFLALRDLSATGASLKAGLSQNTLTKFLQNPEARLSAKSLEKIVEVLELEDKILLESENPLSDPKAAIRSLLESLTPNELSSLEIELKTRFPGRTSGQP